MPPTPARAPCLLKVALVGGQALGGQLLEDVVQHQVHAPLHQLVGTLHMRQAAAAAVRQRNLTMGWACQIDRLTQYGSLHSTGN